MRFDPDGTVKQVTQRMSIIVDHIDKNRQIKQVDGQLNKSISTGHNHTGLYGGTIISSSFKTKSQTGNSELVVTGISLFSICWIQFKYKF